MFSRIHDRICLNRPTVYVPSAGQEDNVCAFFLVDDGLIWVKLLCTWHSCAFAASNVSGMRLVTTCIKKARVGRCKWLLPIFWHSTTRSCMRRTGLNLGVHMHAGISLCTQHAACRHQPMHTACCMKASACAHRLYVSQPIYTIYRIGR